MTAPARATTVDAVLHDASDLIARNGFAQGGWGDPQYGLSPEGAILFAAGVHPAQYVTPPPNTDPAWALVRDAIRAVARALGEPDPGRAYQKVCGWTDSDHAGQVAAVELLGKAAVGWLLAQGAGV